MFTGDCLPGQNMCCVQHVGSSYPTHGASWSKRHMVYIWPEKGVFSYTYTWKSWHLVGFEPTLFGRAKVQPHYAYQRIGKTHMVYIWPEKRCIFLYPRLKKLAPGGIWTHHEVTTICHTNTICYTKRHMIYIWPEKGVFSYTYTEKSWQLVGFEPTMRLQPYSIQIPYAIQKGIWSIFGRKKGVFLIPTPEKVGTWWDLNPHCSAGRRCNHITRISPLAKYPKFGDVTGRSRGGMAGKVLTRQLNGKTESGWDLNTRPLNTAKVKLHYALLCFHQIHQVLCCYCRASRHRYRKSTEIHIDKYWDRSRFEPTPVG